MNLLLRREGAKEGKTCFFPFKGVAGSGIIPVGTVSFQPSQRPDQDGEEGFGRIHSSLETDTSPKLQNKAQYINLCRPLLQLRLRELANPPRVLLQEMILIIATFCREIAIPNSQIYITFSIYHYSLYTVGLVTSNTYASGYMHT